MRKSILPILLLLTLCHYTPAQKLQPSATSGYARKPSASAGIARAQATIAIEFPPPVQKTVEQPAFTVVRDKYTFTIKPLATYDIRAKVRSVHHYHSDWNALLSPVDFVLVWEKMASPEADRYVHCWQSNRWVYYRFPHYAPFTKSYIASHLSNTHILPANDEIKNIAVAVRPGDVVHCKGFLVAITGQQQNGPTVSWQSSLSREDEGDGACEVLWLTHISRVR